MNTFNEERWREIIRLHENGKSYRDIGKIYNISRQRVHQIFFSTPKFIKEAQNNPVDKIGLDT